MGQVIPLRRPADIEVENHGSIWLFRPLTDEARAWIDVQVQAERRFGDAIVVEHRFVGTIVEGAANDGLRVRVN